MRWILGRGLVGSCLLLVAGLLYGRAPVGSWVLHVPVLSAHRGQPDQITLGMAVAFLGLILLTSGWWGLVRQVSGEPDGVRRAWIAAAVWAAPLLIATPLFSNDGWSYVATGYMAGHHLSPYVATPSVLPRPLLSGVSVTWRHTTSPYGPVPLVWGGLASRFTADPFLLLIAHRVLACCGLVMLALAVPRLARRAGHDPARATAVAVASPFVVVQGVGGLHNDMLVVGLLALALCLTRRDQWWWPAVLVGLAAGVKIPGLLGVAGVVLLSLVPGASLARRLGRTARAAGVSLATLLAVSAVSGLGLGWIAGLGVTAHVPARLAPAALAGKWVALLLRATGPAGQQLAARMHPVDLAKYLAALALVAFVGWVLVRRRLPDDRSAIAGAGAVMLAATLLSPALHYWYFLWCLPLLACVPLRRPAERAFLVLLTVLGVVAVADPALHIRWLSASAVAALMCAPPLAWGLTYWLGRRSVGSSQASAGH